MSASEVGLALQWLTSTLSSDGTLSGYAPGGVFRAEAPPATPPPCVIMTYQSSQSHDEIAFGGVRAYSDLIFDIVASGPSKGTQAIANAAARIDTLISVAQQTAITGGTIIACFRVAALETDVLVEGEMWTDMGGTYRLMIKAS